MTNVSVIGAGAIGAYYIWGMYDRENIDLSVIAEGDRKKKLENEGLTINGRQYRLTVRTPEEQRQHGTDLVLVCVKYGALRGILPAVKTITEDKTIVMSPMNGIDSEEIIGEAVGKEHMVGSFMRIASERTGQNVSFDPARTDGIFFGKLPDGAPEEAVQRAARIFDGTGVNYHLSGTIVHDIWDKYMRNICFNLPQAILDVGVGAFYESEHVLWMSKALEEEVRLVAAVEGIELAPLERKRRDRKKAAFSTLQDIRAKRHTEVEMFAGTLIRTAKKHGIQVPCTEYTYHAIRALEEKNDGKFDYTDEE
ncbi:MAG: ketopantoate reductase family protein [Lachnospiraceae bacterium]|jgi:2-dehydropantoate 2-reductase